MFKLFNVCLAELIKYLESERKRERIYNISFMSDEKVLRFLSLIRMDIVN